MRFRRKPSEDGTGEVGGPDAPQGPLVVDVPIRDDMIRLGQFLKLANLIDHGAEAKMVCPEGLVSVNGEVELRRGRQLVKGDVVTLRGQAARVADEGAPDNLPW